MTDLEVDLEILDDQWTRNGRICFDEAFRNLTISRTYLRICGVRERKKSMRFLIVFMWSVTWRSLGFHGDGSHFVYITAIEFLITTYCEDDPNFRPARCSC